MYTANDDMVGFDFDKITMHGTTIESDDYIGYLILNEKRGEIATPDYRALKLYQEKLSSKKKFKCEFSDGTITLSFWITVMEFRKTTYFVKGEGLRSGLFIKFKMLGKDDEWWKVRREG